MYSRFICFFFRILFLRLSQSRKVSNCFEHVLDLLEKTTYINSKCCILSECNLHLDTTPTTITVICRHHLVWNNILPPWNCSSSCQYIIPNKFHNYTTSNVLLTSMFRPPSVAFFRNWMFSSHCSPDGVANSDYWTFSSWRRPMVVET